MGCIWYNTCIPDRRRPRFPEREQRLRSRLRELLVQEGVVRGTIAVREKVCGRPNCRCARGEKHRSVYLVASRAGKLQQLSIPRTLEPQVRRWVDTYQDLRDLLEELSLLHWEKLRDRKS